MHPIQRYRAARGLTQAQLADLIDVNVNSVRAWEKGAAPRPRHLPKLAEPLGVEPLRLFDELEAWRQENEGKEAAAA